MLSNLKTALAAKGMCQRDLAFDPRIQPSVLSEIVRGRRAANAELRRRIAEALGGDEDWLFQHIRLVPGHIRVQGILASSVRLT